MRPAVAIVLLSTIVCCTALPLGNITLPPGFHINIFSSDVPGARSLAVSDSGIVFVSTKDVPGNVYGLLDSTGSGVADTTVVLLTNQNAPNGVAFFNGSLFVSEISRITRYDDAESYVRAKQVVPCMSLHGWQACAHHACLPDCSDLVQSFGNGTVISTAFPSLTWHGNRVMSWLRDKCAARGWHHGWI
jgi:hypothetical protein